MSTQDSGSEALKSSSPVSLSRKVLGAAKAAFEWAFLPSRKELEGELREIEKKIRELEKDYEKEARNWRAILLSGDGKKIREYQAHNKAEMLRERMEDWKEARVTILLKIRQREGAGVRSASAL